MEAIGGWKYIRYWVCCVRYGRLVAMSEEQQVGIEVQVVSPQEESLGLQTPECLLLLLCLYCYRCGEIPHCLYVLCLYHGDIPVYWAFLSVDCQEDDSSPSCTI